MSRIYLPTSEQMDEMNMNLVKIAHAITGTVHAEGFAGIQQVVRSGLGPELFPIGSQIQVNHSVYGKRIFEVVAHDYLKSAHDHNAHTMTLLQQDLLPNMVFDAPEAFYYAEDEIPAGTYAFTLSETYSKWDAGIYHFTLTKPLPKGGQLCINGYADAAMTARKVVAYASRTTTVATETVDIMAGAGGSSIGTFGNNLNHSQRVSYGSNNYAQSAIRQFLNSSAAAGRVWTPQTKFDRPASWVANTAGYMNGLDPDFLGVVGAVNLPCSTNSTFESPDSAYVQNSKYVLRDKFYLISQKELFGNTSSSVADDSELLPFYEGAANVDRIKRNTAGSASYWWLRTPYSSNAYDVRYCNSGGSL